MKRKTKARIPKFKPLRTIQLADLNANLTAPTEPGKLPKTTPYDPDNPPKEIA